MEKKSSAIVMVYFYLHFFDINIKTVIPAESYQVTCLCVRDWVKNDTMFADSLYWTYLNSIVLRSKCIRTPLSVVSTVRPIRSPSRAGPSHSRRLAVWLWNDRYSPAGILIHFWEEYKLASWRQRIVRQYL